MEVFTVSFAGKAKKTIKSILHKLPGFRYLFAKMDAYQRTITDMTNAIKRLENTNLELETFCNQQISEMTQKVMLLNRQVEEQKSIVEKKLEFQNKRIITNKFAIKKANGAPIKVVFLIEEPSIIKNVISIIEEMNKDDRFEVVLINLWYKVYSNDNYTYKRPSIENVIDTSQYIMIEAYDILEDKWFDIETLMPDYVFFSRPYDYYRNELYHIDMVANYARTCYVPYGIQTIGGAIERMVLTPECGNLYYFFMDNALRKEVISEAMQGTRLIREGRLVYLGYPGMDMLSMHDEIRNYDNKRFTILWLPRWNNKENNCHFFEYKDVLVNYAKKNRDCRVTLRPHSLCFNHFLDTGEMTQMELEQLRIDYSAPNRIDETSNYIDAFGESSVLVADETSLIAEYFLTGKPIVFCKKETHFSLLMEKLIEGCYVVNSEEELIDVLEQLKNGHDPMKQIREKIMKETLLDYGKSVACNIKEELWNDFADVCH